MNSYDLIVIGSGPGGYATAATAAAMGRRVAIVERDLLGGTCLNRGCIPTKALCRSAEMALMMPKAQSLGVNIDGYSLDYSAAAERKNSVTDTLREGVATVLKDVEVLHGNARITNGNTIEVNGELYQARQIIIATGSRPATLNIPGAELAMDSDRMLGATTLPKSIAIIGGGVIGMEFASILNAFGVTVTVLEYCNEILPGFDEDVAKRLRMSLKRRGVSIVTGAAVTSITPGCTVNYTAKNKEKNIDAEMVLTAVGRRAVLPEGLDAAGVATDDRGYIITDEKMATTAPGIYAVGDVNGRCMLAHAATAQGRVALGLRQQLDVVPSAVFTTPECAMVGMTEQQCRDRGVAYRAGNAIYRANGKAIAMDEPDGMVKILVDGQSDNILGCHICGTHAADMVQEVAVAMSAGMGAGMLMATIHGHPTLSELIVDAVSKAMG